MRFSTTILSLALVLPSLPSHAQPKPTTLLQDDLSSNRRTAIDASGDPTDADLDAAFGGAQSFSTKELASIEDKIRAELRRDRPRATPRLIAYLYPGRIDVDHLRGLREVLVDIELVMDPCERSVCRDSVGKHIEIVGRAVGQPSRQAPGHKLTFQTLQLQTSVTMHDTEVMTYRVPITDCVAASQRAGGGVAWLASQEHASTDYVPLVTSAIAKHASARRVSLDGPPKVLKAPSSVSVTLLVHGDRSRVQQQLLDALGAAGDALKENPATPRDGTIDVTVETGARDGARHFRAPWSGVALYLARSIDAGALWSTYVAEVKKQAGAQTMGFSDAEASGSPVEEAAGEPDDDQAVAVLTQNFATVGACARAEAGRSSSFRGVTISLTWNPDGRASAVAAKEKNLRGGSLEKCLQSAVGGLRFPRFSGSPRTIEYPIRLK